MVEMNPVISIAVIVLLVPIGGMVAWFTAPQPLTTSFQIHPHEGVAWLNVSEAFWGWGELKADWTNIPGPWANLSAYSCATPACGPANRTLLFSFGVTSFGGSAGGLTAHNYVLVGSNLTWVGNGTATFGFGPSVFAPAALAVSEVEFIGILVATVGTILIIRLAIRMSR